MWPKSGGQLSPPINSSVIQMCRVPVQSQYFMTKNPKKDRCKFDLRIYGRPSRTIRHLHRYSNRKLQITLNISEKVKKKFVNYAMANNARLKTQFAMHVSLNPRKKAQTKLMVKKIIKYARDVNYAKVELMYCLNCKNFPTLPVTGTCGHTRCTECILKNINCPCGRRALPALHINIYVRDLIAKMLPPDSTKSARYCSKKSLQPAAALWELPSTSRGNKDTIAYQFWQATVANNRHENNAAVGENTGHEETAARARQPTYTENTGPEDNFAAQVVQPMAASNNTLSVRVRQPITPLARFSMAQELLASRRDKEAVPHLAHIAASSWPIALRAEKLLFQVISTMIRTADPRRVTRDLYRSVREQATFAPLSVSDLECYVCYGLLKHPVTTPCGHTFCRQCIKRIIDLWNRCPLCSTSLSCFRLDWTADTAFICAALGAVDAFVEPWSPESEFIPIFTCVIAYPSIPCSLQIFHPHNWPVIEHILNSGARRFGIVGSSDNGIAGHVGTVVEVRDCVQLEDMGTILSTVGVTRFMILETIHGDGCQLARIQTFHDVKPTCVLSTWKLQITAHKVYYKALLWLATLDSAIIDEIETAFGQMPSLNQEEEWWNSPDGPQWLWWLITILPLKPDLQFLILSTDLLVKRLMAVSRTLDIMRQPIMSPVLCSCVFDTKKYLFFRSRQS